MQVETAVEDTLAELKPGRELHTNVEWYAAVVMDRCGLPRDLFTPTFAASRVVGWCAHALEQHADNRIIRPSSRYIGPPPPQPVPDEPNRESAEAMRRQRAPEVVSDTAQTSSIRAIGALSPWRGPSLRMRV